MRKSRRIQLIVVGLLLAATAVFVGFAVRRPEQIHRVAQVVDWDGQRQVEHFYLGFVPYTELQPRPGMKITPEVFAAFDDAGIKNLPAISPEKRLEMCSRTTRQGRFSYFVQAQIKDPLPSALKFYGAQLKNARQSFPDTVEGDSKDGRWHIRAFSAGFDSRINLELVPK